MSTVADTGEREALLRSLAESHETGPSPETGDHLGTASPTTAQTPGTEPVASGETQTNPVEAAVGSKFRDMRERAARSWADVQAERAKLAEERKTLEAERQRPPEQAPAPATDAKSGYKPEQYESLAKQFEAEGRPDLAKLAQEEATRLRQNETEARAQEARNGLVKAWTGNLNSLIGKHPSLQDPQSEMHQRVDELLRKRPVLFTYPEGILDAVEAVSAYIAGAKAGSLEKEVAALKRQLADAEKLLQPTKGGPAAPPRSENFDELPLTQQRSALMREMQSADAGA